MRRRGKRGASGRATYGLQGLDEHEPADHPQKDNVAKAHKQIDLTKRFQIVEEDNASCGANEATDQQNRAHSQIDRFPSQMRQNPGKGGSDDLVGFRCNGNGRGDADKKEQGSHQKATTHAEHARKYSHKSA